MKIVQKYTIMNEKVEEYTHYCKHENWATTQAQVIFPDKKKSSHSIDMFVRVGVAVAVSLCWRSFPWLLRYILGHICHHQKPAHGSKSKEFR